MRRLKKTLLAAVITAPFLTAPPQAQAQWAVIDTANLAQNIMTAAHSLEEVNNQVTQIQQFLQMLEYAARNAATLPFSVLSQLQSSMTELNSLMGQAQSLSYDVNRLEQQFQDLYPTYGASGRALTQLGLLADARARWAASVDTYRHTMTVQSQIVAAIPADQADLSALVDESQGAAGTLQAIQSGNQLLALQSHQLSATQDLLAASARSQAAEAMRHAEVENAAKAEWQRFYGNGVGYTSTEVQVFGGSPP